MSGPTRLGAIGGVALGLASVAPQPLGLGAFWAAVGLHVGVAAAILWRRTRLPFATCGLGASAVGSLLLCGLNIAGYRWPASGEPLPGLPLIWAVPVLALLFAGPLFLLVEARAHGMRYRAWRRRQKALGVFDLIRYRDIPDVRHECGAGQESGA